MAEDEPKKVEPEPPQPQDPPPEPAPVEEEKSVVPPPLPPPPPEEKAEDTKTLAVVEKPIETPVEKSNEGSVNRDAELARVETQKKLSLIRAWEESEKTKAENKAQKKLSAIGSWENSKKASIEADLKKIEEKLEKKKAEYAETMKNKIA
ncbi:hypothetical protein NL676_000245 [Syzygium grande]|nr:hypothetical protein NL676_000245 [Syzygium grande]